MKLNILIILIFIYSCTARPTDNEIKNVSVADSSASKTTIADTTNNNTEIIETFADSLNIGEKGKNKIELIKHRVFDNNYVIVKFYTKATDPYSILEQQPFHLVAENWHKNHLNDIG